MREERHTALSVIIPCRGHAAELEACLAGLSRMRVEATYEIIVVDSASDPGVAAAVRAHPAVRLVRSDRDLSPGPARNLGVDHARGGNLVFLDADCVPAVGWLQAAHEGLQNSVQMVGGPVLDALPHHPIAVIDNLLQFAELAPGRPAGAATYLPGCNVGLRREAFHALGGFPPHRWTQDSLFTDAIARRWPDACRFVPDMQVAHRGRTTLKELWTHHARFGHERGLQGFRITPFQQRLCAHWAAVPLSMSKRLGYIVSCVFRWNRRQLLRDTLLLPLLLFGLLGWSVGFRQGCRNALENRR